MCAHNTGSSLEFFQLLNTEKKKRGCNLVIKQSLQTEHIASLKKKIRSLLIFIYILDSILTFMTNIDCAHNVCAFVKPETRLFSVHFLKVKAVDS